MGGRTEVDVDDVADPDLDDLDEFTDRIAIGSGVVNNWTRNVGLLAATFSTLDDLAPGRVRLGIGAWWDPLAAKVGIHRHKNLTAMRETVEAVRRLLAMERVTYDGEFVHLEDVEIDIVHGDRSPKDVPIYIGATAMRMMELAGEIGDGVLEVQQVDVPAPGTREVLVEIAQCGICGTDLHLVLEEIARPGSVLGHEWAGTVAAVGGGAVGTAGAGRFSSQPTIVKAPAKMKAVRRRWSLTGHLPCRPRARRLLTERERR